MFIFFSFEQGMMSPDQEICIKNINKIIVDI